MQQKNSSQMINHEFNDKKYASQLGGNRRTGERSHPNTIVLHKQSE